MAALRLHLSGVLFNQKVTSKLKSRDLLLSRKILPFQNDSWIIISLITKLN